MNGIENIKNQLSQPKVVSILSHRNPDGDALGSSLALKQYLEVAGHLVHVILPSSFPSIFSYLKGSEDCIIYDDHSEDAMAKLEASNVIFMLDFNALDRIDKMAKTVEESSAFKVMIDHHLDPEPVCDEIISIPSASSTCEILYDFLVEIGGDTCVAKYIGECLFSGLITDTGNFRYNTNPNTYQVASKLKEVGVDDYYINDRIFNRLKEKNLRLLGHCLANRMEILPEYKTGIIYLTRDDYAEYDIQRGDTEGVVNYILQLDGIEVAAFIHEQPTIVKLSLRSKGDISVQEIASRHFNGGGHKNAAGGAAYASLDDIINRFKQVIPNYIK